MVVLKLIFLYLLCCVFTVASVLVIAMPSLNAGRNEGSALFLAWVYSVAATIWAAQALF